MKTCVIYNPRSGHMDERRLRETFANWPQTQLMPTQGPGDGGNLAHVAAQKGATTIIAVGGDGTIGEIVNGLGEFRERVKMGILPLGTGNDFARSLFIPLEWDSAVEVLQEGAAHRFDLVKVCWEGNGLRYFVNVCVGGFSQAAKEQIEGEFKANWGPFGYILAGLESATQIQPYRVELQWDDEAPETLEASILIVANAGFMSAGIPIVPAALPNDGKLDLLAICPTHVADLAGLVPWVLAGKPIWRANWVVHKTAHRLTVHSRSGHALPYRRSLCHLPRFDL